jgi:anti-repressor protein
LSLLLVLQPPVFSTFQILKMQDSIKADLIKVSETARGTIVVSARDLHQSLEIKTQFTDWCKRMFEYGFTENLDYVAVTQKKVTAQGNANAYTDYALTLDAAKHIAMVQRTPKGKELRQYFIEVEKKHNEPKPVISIEEHLVQQAQIIFANSKRIKEIESRVDQLEAMGSTIPTGFLTISGYAAKLASRKCLELGYITGSVHSEKFGSVKSYPIEALQMVFDEFFSATPSRLSDIR